MNQSIQRIETFSNDKQTILKKISEKNNKNIRIEYKLKERSIYIDYSIQLMIVRSIIRYSFEKKFIN